MTEVKLLTFVDLQLLRTDAQVRKPEQRWLEIVSVATGFSSNLASEEC